MKEKLLNIARITTFFPRKILDLFLFNIYLKRKNDWQILKKYFDRPILIIGNGPSLNNTPLHNIKDSFVSIGMNKINLIFDNSKWRPDIITCVNALVIRQNKEFFNRTNIVLILPIKAFYLGVKPRKNILFVKIKDEEKLESNIESSVSIACTVTFTAIQIAAYLKPKSVNIVGVDHSFVIKKGEDQEIRKFEGDDINHFSKDYFKNQYWGIPNLDGSEKLYQISKYYFDQKKIPIKDYTINGKLKIFEKGDINDLIKSAF